MKTAVFVQLYVFHQYIHGLFYKCEVFLDSATISLQQIVESQSLQIPLIISSSVLRSLCLWEDSNFLSAVKFTAIATRVRVCFQSCTRRGEREGKQRQRGNRTRCAVKRRCSRPCVFLSGCRAENVSKLNHFHPRAKSQIHTHTHMLCSQLRALCLSILVIICLPASLLVALGNAHLSLD